MRDMDATRQALRGAGGGGPRRQRPGPLLRAHVRDARRCPQRLCRLGSRGEPSVGVCARRVPVDPHRPVHPEGLQPGRRVRALARLPGPRRRRQLVVLLAAGLGSVPDLPGRGGPVGEASEVPAPPAHGRHHAEDADAAPPAEGWLATPRHQQGRPAVVQGGVVRARVRRRSRPPLAFSVRDPLRRFVSEHRLEADPSARPLAEGLALTGSLEPWELAAALGDAERAPEAWAAVQEFSTLQGVLGGILNVHGCLVRGRISFVGRTEFVAEDAVGLYQAIVGPPPDDTSGGHLWLNIHGSALNRSVHQEIGAAGVRALSAFLAEDYFILSLLARRGLLPPSYLEQLGVQARGPPQDACAEAGPGWLARLLPAAPGGGPGPWWLVWLDGGSGRCRVAGAVEEAVATAVRSALLRRDPGSAPFVVPPRGGRLGEAAGPCAAHLEEVATALCTEQAGAPDPRQGAAEP
ncbi:unnamed protein product [Prorocentrum cordatum]|uniref:Uncharacterized protein n=1 Tax=Prorocentrum cordatum TaxID=2364126 RepID=A0ABN9VIE4_9DINO|nr:unnamed protein product [Polarella glacialis]